MVSLVKKKQESLFQDTQNGVKCPDKWFRENVNMDECVCVCARAPRARACMDLC